MHQDVLAKEIECATKAVFTTMIGLDVTAGEAVEERSAPGPSNGVVALIGLAGSWVGTGSVSCSATAACHFSSQFLMTEFHSVDEAVLDAMAELTNMIIGGFKTAVEKEVGPMGLSIPTVVFGRNFTTRTVSRSSWLRVPFTCAEDPFDVHICLAPKHKPEHHPHPESTVLRSVFS